MLDHGASVYALDRFGSRTLSHAARFGHLQMVDLLLARDALRPIVVKLRFRPRSPCNLMRHRAGVLWFAVLL
jgi:ankyrin repeat protein